MSTWILTVKATHGEYEMPIGPDEAVALRVLQDAGKQIGKSGTVTIAERLVLRAEDILSASLSERD